MQPTKKHVREFEGNFGNIYYKSYYEFTGKISFELPFNKKNISYDINSIDIINENNIMLKYFYISFHFLSDDPTEDKIIVYYYNLTESNIHDIFVKLKNRSKIKLFLEKRVEGINEFENFRHENDKSDYKIFERQLNHNGTFLFRDNFVNRILYFLQINFSFFVRFTFTFYLFLLFFIYFFDLENQNILLYLFCFLLIFTFSILQIKIK